MFDKIIEWLFGVMARPVQTLNEIAREKPVGWALMVALGVGVLTLAANTLRGEGIEETMVEMDIFIAPLYMFIFGVIIIVVGLFVITGLLHLIAKLFGGQGGYWNLFSAYCFAEFPMIISVPVSLVSIYLGFVGTILGGLTVFGLGLWVIVLQVIALRESHGISTGASIGAYAIHFLLIIAIPVAIVITLVTAFLVSI